MERKYPKGNNPIPMFLPKFYQFFYSWFKKEVFEWTRTGQKNIELHKGILDSNDSCLGMYALLKFTKILLSS